MSWQANALIEQEQAYYKKKNADGEDVDDIPDRYFYDMCYDMDEPDDYDE